MNTINTYNQHNIRLGSKAMYTNIVNSNNSTLAENNLSGLVKARHFAAVEARIYFGDVYIDEAQYINFSVAQNTIPIMGYNSYVTDVFAQGSRIIQGSFIINFTKSSYLYEVMNALSNVNSGATLPKISKTCNNPTVSKSVKAPMWDKCFDIVTNNIIEGDQVVSLSTTVILKGVHLMSCEQQFGTAGENGGAPIAEQYTFYARDIDFDVPTNNQVSEDIDETIIVKDDLIIDSVVAKYNSGSYDIICKIINNNKDIIELKDASVNIIFNSSYNLAMTYDEKNNYFKAHVSTNKSAYRNGFNYMIATYLYKMSMVNDIPIVTVSVDYPVDKEEDRRNLTTEIQITYK